MAADEMATIMNIHIVVRRLLGDTLLRDEIEVRMRFYNSEENKHALTHSPSLCIMRHWANKPSHIKALYDRYIHIQSNPVKPCSYPRIYLILRKATELVSSSTNATDP
jgi:hypothetical protein